ncbi:regulatory protein GemA [Alcaligenaceae bacterium]|nr:regulatory protein GemA [Alcaligenaceae bacterium]
MKAKDTARRTQLIRLIHVAKRDLHMGDDTYRHILISIGGRDSSADLPVSKLGAVLEHMKKAGFKVRSKQGGKPGRAMAMDTESRKVRALWLFLHEIEAVRDPSEGALAAYVKRMAGVDALQWVNGKQIETVIEALKKWAMRVLPGLVREMAHATDSAAMSPDMAQRLNGALANAFARNTFEPMRMAYEMLRDLPEHSEVDQ